MDLKKEPKRIQSKKPGRLSHHPLMAFIADCKMVANYWQRSGDAYTSNNIESFLDDTFEKLGKKKIGLFRADSGFYDKKYLTIWRRSPSTTLSQQECMLLSNITLHHVIIG
ncbi:MAG: hypothetical protein IPG55_06645 [Saprospiraceae bacterium]|nr:hypothetical protein [Candidatus Defluviibacterium haderslevense]